MSSFFGGFILAVWIIFFGFLSWDPKQRPIVNIIVSVVSFIICGAFYLVPVWLIFMR